jgi:hypothetical protein
MKCKWILFKFIEISSDFITKNDAFLCFMQ